MSVKEEFEVRKPDRSNMMLWSNICLWLNLDIYPGVGCIHGLGQGRQTFSVKG